MEYTDTIVLPNGGIIYLDKLAYDTLESQASGYDRYRNEWTMTIYFSDRNKNKKKEQLNIR